MKKNKYYQDLSIPVENFFGFLLEKDFKYLLIKKKKVNLKDQFDLEQAFLKIFHEYCFLTGDTTLLNQYKKEIYITALSTKIDFIVKILDLFNNYGNPEVLVLLQEFNIKIDLEKEIEPQIKKVISKVKGLKNKKNIFILKNKNEKDKDNKKFNLEKEALNMEIALDLKYAIDVKTTSMKRWIAIINLIKSKKNG